jgi:hypothetical protein
MTGTAGDIAGGKNSVIGAEVENRPDFPFRGVRPFFMRFEDKENKVLKLTKWVRCDGKTYCWEKISRKVVEVKITDVPLDNVPKDVLVAMLEKETEKEE